MGETSWHLPSWGRWRPASRLHAETVEKHLNSPIWIFRHRNGFPGTFDERLHGIARLVVFKDRIRVSFVVQHVVRRKHGSDRRNASIGYLQPVGQQIGNVVSRVRDVDADLGYLVQELLSVGPGADQARVRLQQRLGVRQSFELVHLVQEVLVSLPQRRGTSVPDLCSEGLHESVQGFLAAGRARVTRLKACDQLL